MNKSQVKRSQYPSHNDHTPFEQATTFIHTTWIQSVSSLGAMYQHVRCTLKWIFVFLLVNQLLALPPSHISLNYNCCNCCLDHLVGLLNLQKNTETKLACCFLLVLNNVPIILAMTIVRFENNIFWCHNYHFVSACVCLCVCLITSHIMTQRPALVLLQWST